MTESTPLTPGDFVEFEFDLQPDDQVIPAGQKIGLMIMSSDREFTLWPAPGSELEVDLGATSIEIPIVGGREALEGEMGTH
jgi:X-Pro dipeptidyl-peptidase